MWEAYFFETELRIATISYYFFIYFLCHSNILFNASMGEKELTSNSLIPPTGGLFQEIGQFVEPHGG